MDAQGFFDFRIKRAKEFGFPDPIFVNAEKLSQRTRVIYLVEIQATFISDKVQNKTHHYALKFSKFKKVKEENNEQSWTEEDIVTNSGFTISDKESLEKLAAYIKTNEELLGADVLSQDYVSVILSNDEMKIDLLKRILGSNKDKEMVYSLLKDQYPDLDKKILTFRLVQSRKKALKEFQEALSDTEKKERNYWQPFLEKNRWMFGLSYFVLLDESRVDLGNTADYLFESDDGFIDIVEIKHPHVDFWQKNTSGEYKRYRGFLQQSEELKGSITQAVNYIFQVEKKFSDPDWCRLNKCETPVKPKCTVILGRSYGWEIDEKTAFRLMNDSLHGIEVITFDHLFNRAQRLLNSLEKET